MERVRAVAMGDAELLPRDIPARLDGPGGSEQLSLTTIINFAGLCLVRDAQDGVWYMGKRDDDGTVVCWAPTATTSKRRSERSDTDPVCRTARVDAGSLRRRDDEA